MARYHPQAKIVGVDHTDMRHELRVPIDYEGPTFWNNDELWQLIHVNQLRGFIGDLKVFYSNILAHLDPGSGHLEHIVIDHTPRCDDGSLPVDGPIMTWWRTLYAVMRQAQPPHAHDYESLASKLHLLESLGFVDIEGNIIMLPINSDNTAFAQWPSGRGERVLGRYYGDTIADADGEALDALSAAAFTRYGATLPKPWAEYKWAVRAEMMKEEVHVYNLLYIITARKRGNYEPISTHRHNSNVRGNADERSVQDARANWVSDTLFLSIPVVPLSSLHIPSENRSIKTDKGQPAPTRPSAIRFAIFDFRLTCGAEGRVPTVPSRDSVPPPHSNTQHIQHLFPMLHLGRNLFLPPTVSAVWRRISNHLPPLNFITLHYAYFLGVCMLSSIIFWGSSTPPKSVTYVDSLFLVVSAMTLAGLNTVNLSTLNTFQQFILFVLIILGSAILVSILVVHTRRKAFERRFRSIVEEERQRRRGRTGSWRRSFSRSFGRSGVVEDGAIGRGRVIRSERDSHEGSRDPVGKAPSDPSLVNAQSPSTPPLTEDHQPPYFTQDVKAGHEPLDTTHDDPKSNIDTVVTRRITFAAPSSPTRQRQHGRILSMQGVGARQNTMNYPKRRVNTEDLPKIDEGRAASLRSGHGGRLSGVFVGRNSQFSNLSLADRTRLGGVEYRAVTVLALVVPAYFVLWQLLGCIGLGAYVATKRPDTARTNGLNPWWMGAFNGVSAFNNSGMSLLDTNMTRQTAFQTADYILITMGLMILAGNTCFPVFLRLILWTIWKLLPASDTFDDHRVALRFLLDHPRRCYTNLFPSRHTWWLLAAVVCLNSIDWVAFEVLNIGNTVVTSLPTGARVLDGLFQALAVRSGGFYVIAIPNLRIGLLILYVVMMYISVYPVVITMRNSNVYEERSLGIYADDPQIKDIGGKERADHTQHGQQTSEHHTFLGSLKRRFIQSNGVPESRSYFIRQQLRSQLSHDLWWITLAVLFIAITETSQFERDPVSFSVFNVLFEVVSAYGCVGISVGFPTVAYSFCGQWHVLSKLILCAVMIRGRHRGLPVAIDRAVLLPGEHLAAAEEQDAKIKLERTRTLKEGEKQMV
ncbi:MAG: hypothetical protein Q9163_001370 [Psora crenata]